MRKFFMFFFAILLCGLLGSELYSSKRAYIPSLDQVVKVRHGGRITQGDTIQLARVLHQFEGSYDTLWNVLDENLKLDTLMEKALFQKKNAWPDEDPLTKGTLEYRIAVWR